MPAPAADGPGACLAATNTLLAEENEAAMFVTVFYGILDTVSGVLCYANAGHPSPCVIAADGTVTTLRGTGGMALGVIADNAYREARVTLGPGSQLLLYTDGVTEAFDLAETDFGEARLLAVLAGAHGLSAAGVVERVVAAVTRFAGAAPQADDLTCLVARFVGTGGGTGGGAGGSDEGELAVREQPS